MKQIIELFHNTFKMYLNKTPALVLLILAANINIAEAQDRGNRMQKQNNQSEGNVQRPARQQSVQSTPQQTQRPTRVQGERTPNSSYQSRPSNTGAERQQSVRIAPENRISDNTIRQNTSRTAPENRFNDNSIRQNSIRTNSENRINQNTNQLNTTRFNNERSVQADRFNYRRPSYSANNPSWHYANLPRRNTVITTIPITYRTINYGGYNYRYDHGIFYRPYNNTFMVVAPPIGIYINTLPFGYRRIYVNNYPYYYYNGTYYDYHDNNYLVVSPPVGAIVESLPEGYQTITIEGETYYTVDGAQYKPVVQENGEVWYEVIKAN